MTATLGGMGNEHARLRRRVRMRTGGMRAGAPASRAARRGGSRVLAALALLGAIGGAVADGAAPTQGACAPAAGAATWAESDIRSSRVVHPAGAVAPLPGSAAADELAVVSAAPDRRLSVPRDRFSYVASPDGWVRKVDLRDRVVVAEVRVGLAGSALSVAGDGTHVAVANCLPRTLVLLDRDLALLKVHPVLDREGRRSGHIATVRDAPSRRSFIATLADVAEVWEVSYDPRAEDVPVGVIHDFQYREGAFVRGYLNPRRSVLPEPLGDFLLTPDQSELLGATRAGDRAQVVNLDVRRMIVAPDLPALAAPGEGTAWTLDGQPVMAVRARADGAIFVIDVGRWHTLRTIPAPGPGRFVRTHEAIPYAWAESAQWGTLVVIDKRTLERVAEVGVAPAGAARIDLEFSRDGRLALAGVVRGADDGGEVVMLDSTRLAELDRIPVARAGRSDRAGMGALHDTIIIRSHLPHRRDPSRD